MLPKDVRYALRLFAKSPGFVSMAVLALAFGIGANSSMFSFVNVYLLRPLPAVRDANRVVLVQSQQRGNWTATSYPDFMDWEKQSHAFEAASAVQRVMPVVVGLGEPERVLGARVSRAFFAVFPTDIPLGRAFLPSEVTPGGERVMLLSNGFWQRRFGSAPDVTNRSLRLDGVSHRIIGVLPPGFRISWQDYDFFAPLPAEVLDSARGKRQLDVMARLRPGATLASAQAEMDTIASRLEMQYPDTNAGIRAGVRDLLRTIGDGPRESVTILMGVVVFVLLIACSNVANLQLARATGRRNEIAIRLAMGAGRGRIIRQLIIESVLVSLAGGAIGIGLAYAFIKLLLASMPAMIHPFNQNFLDPLVLAFTAAVAIATGLLSGIAPAFQVSRVGVNDTLKDGGRSGASSGSRARLRSALVVVEVALALVLLLAAGLLIKGFAGLQQVDPGFRPARLLIANVWLPETKYAQPQARATFFRDLVNRAAGLPGVESAAASSGIPLGGGGGGGNFVVEGRPAPEPGHENFARTNSITPNYLHTMGMQLRRGRCFTEQDAAGALPVAIVNERFVRQFFPGADPIGRRIKLSRDPGADAPWLTIAGVTGDLRPWGLGSQPAPEVYLPMRQQPSASSWILLRTRSADPAGAAPGLRAALRELDRGQPVTNVKTMERRMQESMTIPHMMMVLITVFACLALAMAALGIYGVVSYSVVQRTHELGIRMALGAGQASVVRLVLRQAGWMILLGAAIGVPAAAGVTRVLESFLFGVGARDPLTFVIIPLVLAAVALLASFVPARRATRVDPVVALRYQ